jgi:hypothetical protein
MLTAIDAVYRGYRLRSRLEARWAVFLETCGHPPIKYPCMSSHSRSGSGHYGRPGPLFEIGG